MQPLKFGRVIFFPRQQHFGRLNAFQFARQVGPLDLHQADVAGDQIQPREANATPLEPQCQQQAFDFF